MAAVPTVFPDETVLHNGIYLPSKFPRYRENPEQAVEYLRTFPSRPTDILICGPIKSGNHWIFEIISILISGKLEYSKNTLIDSHLDFIDENELENREDPRILSTHAPYDMIPEKHKNGKYKIVFILRNPKDRFVSYFEFALGKAEAFPLDLPWSSFYETNVIGERDIFGGWFNYTKEWEKQMSMNSNIYLVYYEDLKRNFVQTVEKLAEFLEVKRNESFYEKMEEICSFRGMKDNKEDNSVQFNDVGETLLYRKGEIGDWKNYFSVSQNEQFDKKYRKEMGGSTLTFIYE